MRQNQPRKSQKATNKQIVKIMNTSGLLRNIF